jgi:hypothetical protein
MYKMVCSPMRLLALGLAFMLLPVVVALAMDSLWEQVLFVAGTALLAMALWLAGLLSVRRRSGGLEGLLLSLLVDLCFLLYTVGVIGLVVSGLVFLEGLMRQELIQCVLMLMATAVCVGLIVLAYLGDRFVGRRCLRRQSALAANAGSARGEEE